MDDPDVGKRDLDSTAMLFTLYHSRTSVCSAKVRLVLDEKGFPFESRLLNLMKGEQHDPDYARLNPKEVVPTLVHDARVLVESSLIVQYLDEVAPTPALMPAEPYARQQARLFMKKIDDTLHAACSTVSFAAAFRKVWADRSPEELETHLAKNPDPAYRERQRLSITQGMQAPHVRDAVRNHVRYLDDMDKALGETDYLAGPGYSLADACATPYVSRAETIGLDCLWRERPRISAWFARMRERPNFATAITDWVTDDDRKRLSVDRPAVEAAVRKILEAD